MTPRLRPSVIGDRVCTGSMAGDASPQRMRRAAVWADVVAIRSATAGSIVQVSAAATRKVRAVTDPRAPDGPVTMPAPATWAQ